MRNTNASRYCFFSFLTSSSELSVSESLTSSFFTAFSFLLESLKNGFIVLGNECYRPRYSVLVQNTHRAFSPREFPHHFRQEYSSLQHRFSRLRVVLMQQTEAVDFSCIISCLCPLSFSKVKHPVRGPRCDHIRFFDRDSFVEVIPCLPYHF